LLCAEQEVNHVSKVLCSSLNNPCWDLVNSNILLPVLDVIEWLNFLLLVKQLDLGELTEALFARPFELGILKEMEADVLKLDEVVL